MMNLHELNERYKTIAASPGAEVALASFGLTDGETETLFSGLDEDYHISRFLHFSEKEGKSYSISGERVTHVSIDPEIQEIL